MVNARQFLNQPIPLEGRSFQYAAWGVVLLVLVHLCWLQSHPESELHQFCTVATQSTARRTAMTQQEQSVRIAVQATDGNVLLKLAGYAKTNPFVADSLCYLYFRTSYTLYPRRVYAGPADKVVNNGRDIMRIRFSPSPQWLQEHDVRSVLVFGNDNDSGQTLWLEILPPRDDRAGMQADKSGGNR